MKSQMTKIEKAVLKKMDHTTDHGQIAEELKISVQRMDTIYEKLKKEGLIESKRFGLTTREEGSLLAAAQSWSNDPAHSITIATVTPNFYQAENREAPPTDVDLAHLLLNSDTQQAIDLYKQAVGGIDIEASLKLTRRVRGPNLQLVFNESINLRAAKRWGIEPVTVVVAKCPHLTLTTFSGSGHQAAGRFEDLANTLSTRKLAVKTIDLTGAPSIALTQAGYDLAQDVVKWRRDEPTRKLRAAHVPRKIECPNCRQTLLQTTWRYVPESSSKISGLMLANFGEAARNNWSTCAGFAAGGPNNIVCPSCDSSLLTKDGTDFLPGVLSVIEPINE